MKSKRIVMIIFMVCLLLTLLTGCKQQSQEGNINNDNEDTQQFQPGTFTDDMGRQVEINEVPERIVSFGPSITEILFALGLGDKVVGVTDFCDYPDEALDKPKVGNAWSPSIESVVELDPDLVLTVESKQFTSELEALGITYLILDPEEIYSITDNIRLVGEVTGAVAEGEKLANAMEDIIDNITERIHGVDRPKVFMIIDATEMNMPWTSGGGSFIHDIITIVGGENIAAWVVDDYVQLSIEEIVDAEPDIIVVQTWGEGIPVITVEELQEHIIWQQLGAIKQGSIYSIDVDIISRPGPRIVQGLEEMARIIHPELFN